MPHRNSLDRVESFRNLRINRGAQSVTKALRWLPVTLSALSMGTQATEAPVSTPDPETSQRAAGQMVKPFFSEIDCENLGYVQTDEVDEHSGPIFLSFDVDRSRAIEPQEWRSYPFMRDKPLMALSFSIADKDRNGSVDYREFNHYLRSAVDSLDTNGDGELHPDELGRYVSDSQPVARPKRFR